jgi:hypothetical protein
MTNEKVAKSGKSYHCSDCDYLTCRKSHWQKHIETKKHKILTNPNMDNVRIIKCLCGREYKHSSSLCAHKKKCKFQKNDTIKKMDNKWITLDNKWITSDNCPKSQTPQNEKLFKCECGKVYKYLSGLSKHKTKCVLKDSPLLLVAKTSDVEWKEMFIKLMEKHADIMEQNKEIIEQNTELARKPTNITNNTQFNVMNYLNTECKDAMNMSDFINDFQFSFQDLEMLGTKGYQETMERTFVKQLFDMDKTKRPIHCSDKKRKSFYIKDNDVWEKDLNNKKLIRCFKNLSNVHNRMLGKWQSYNNDWCDNDKKHDFYLKYVVEFTKCDHEKETNKIINKLVALTIR